MGILDFLGAGQSIAAPIDAVGNALSKIVTTDKDREAADAVMEQLRQNPAALQVEINKLEAQSTSKFNSGWRPGIGWVCAISLALFFIPQFILGSFLWTYMCVHSGQLVPYPINPDGVIELTLAVLGIYGTHRTIEKIAGKAK